MSDVLDRYRQLADDYQRRLEAVPDSAWTSQSPCEEWKAKDVAEHVNGVGRGFHALLGGSEPAPASGDPVADWKAMRADVEAALADPELAGKPVQSPMGPMPYEALVGRLQSVDMLVHTWDLARAAGLDDTINADACAHALQGLTPLDGMIRGPGMFGPKIEPPAGADAQTQLLCFLGRKV
jgi:uncharacterized protein (TIGR03086 family)